MKVHLLHPDRDVDVRDELRDAMFAAMLDGSPVAMANVRRNLERGQVSLPLPSRLQALASDLELDTVWTAMAGGDEFVLEVVRRVTLSGLSTPRDIVYRQQVLADCLARPAAIRELYDLAIEALESTRAVGGLWRDAAPTTVLRRSVSLLTLYVRALRRLREIAERVAGGFGSDGFTRFFARIRAELSDDYLQVLEEHLRDLAFEQGVLESARPGKGDKGRDYVVHRQPRLRWTDRLLLRARGPRTYSFAIAPRDEAGFKALDELRSRGLNHVADAVARSADHVRGFFALLRLELGFCLGCLNLHGRLEEKGEPACMPEPRATGAAALHAKGLVDVSLALHLPARAVGNDLAADGRALVLITGANQGGKSTFLRSVGLAQLMMQSGMFVAATAFSADVSSGIFTHFKREEDAALQGGKLDEELARMSAIADAIAPGALLLCNESFASTNEREGSEIARQVLRALLERGIRVLLVTHMHDLARGVRAEAGDAVLSLRPERREDGERTFRLQEGEPQPTSHGLDAYRRIFGAGAASEAGLDLPRPA